MTPLRCALALLAALWLPARPSRAEPPAPGLNWVRLPGADACIAAASLAQRVEERVGRVLFAATSEAGLFVDGTVAPAPAPEQGWRVRLELSDREGKVLGRRDMQFPAGDCRAIDEAVALVIAVTLYPNTSLLEHGIALDPSTAASLQALFGQEPTDPDPASLPSAASAPATPAPGSAHGEPRVDRAEPARTSAPATRGSDAWRFDASAAGTAGVGHVPALGLGLSAHLAITPPAAFPIELGLVLFPETSVTPPGVRGEVRFDLLAASLAVCPWQPSWWSALAFCAGGEVGRLHVASEGFAAGSFDTDDPVGSLTGTVRVLAKVAGPLALRVALIASVPLAQHRYTVQTDTGDTETAFRIPQLAARAELGLGLAF